MISMTTTATTRKIEYMLQLYSILTARLLSGCSGFLSLSLSLPFVIKLLLAIVVTASKYCINQSELFVCLDLYYVLDAKYITNKERISSRARL